MKKYHVFSRLVGLLIVFSVALLAVGSSLSTPRLAAQSAQETPLAAAERLRQVTAGNVVVRYADATGVARFVRATSDAGIPLSSSASAPEDKAYAFFEEYGAVFGVRDARNELAIKELHNDEYGSDVRLTQRYQGLPVFYAELIVHYDDAGNISAVNGSFVPGLKVPAQPVLSPADAVVQALTAVASVKGVDVAGLQAAPAVLGVIQSNLAQDLPGEQALVWSTSVTGGPSIRQFVYVDAINGGIVEIFEGIAHEKQRETYDTHQSDDYESATICQSEMSEPSSTDLDCNNAHTYSGDTYNFFYNGFKRDSFDNQGAPLISYVHYFSSICPNAFWNGRFMTYCETFPHDDVAGHEIVHGVTEFSANLVYAYQPGALNESFSDIFGEAIDLLNEGENEPESEWKIGEGIAPVGLRDMRDPENPAYGNPSHCGSELYECTSYDNGGVHINSGVPNKAFQLMVDGGSLNGVAVAALDRERAVSLNQALAIQYRTLTRYLTPMSDFTDNAEALLASCKDLRNKRIYDADPETGGGVLPERISREDCSEVANAINAVKMTASVCTDYAPDAAGALCAGGETVARLFFDDHESGSQDWTASNDPARYNVDNWQPVSDFTFSGTRAWRINDVQTECASGADYTADIYLISPEVNLTGRTRPVLRFVHDFFTEGSYDGGTVEVNVNGEWVKLENRDYRLNGYNGSFSLLSTAPNWTPISRNAFMGYMHPNQFPALSYFESRVDLTNYVAQDVDKRVQLRFRFGTDYCNGTEVGWYLDDVEIYECVKP